MILLTGVTMKLSLLLILSTFAGVPCSEHYKSFRCLSNPNQEDENIYNIILDSYSLLDNLPMQTPDLNNFIKKYNLVSKKNRSFLPLFDEDDDNIYPPRKLKRKEVARLIVKMDQLSLICTQDRFVAEKTLYKYIYFPKNYLIPEATLAGLHKFPSLSNFFNKEDSQVILNEK